MEFSGDSSLTWTFDRTRSTSKDKVRAAIGDTDQNNHRFADEEIAAVLAAKNDSVSNTALQLIDEILAKLAPETDRALAGVNVARTQAFEQFEALRKRLERQRIVDAGAGLFVGGVSHSTADTLDEDIDFRQPAFAVGRDSIPGGREDP